MHPCIKSVSSVVAIPFRSEAQKDHAKASQVLLQLTIDEAHLLLLIKDDGVGFNLARLQKRASRVATLGLVSMQERAHFAGGAIEINSARSKGTEIRLSLPLH